MPPADRQRTIPVSRRTRGDAKEVLFTFGYVLPSKNGLDRLRKAPTVSSPTSATQP